MVDFGSKLKDMRINKHLSQEQLAKRIGITKSMVSAYETSMRMPSYEVLIKIALFFNVSLDYLLGLKEYDFLNVSGLSERQKAILADIICKWGERIQLARFVGAPVGHYELFIQNWTATEICSRACEP